MTNQILRKKRHKKIRMKISGTAKRPRLCVYRSIESIYAQLIDDETGKTILNTSDLKLDNKKTKLENAKEVGLKIAELAKTAKIKNIVFDRNGYKFHGRVKAVAEGAREGGLKF